MSLFDKLRRKTTNVVEEHGDRVEQGIDKTADVADEKTGGKYSEKVDAGADHTKDALDRLDGKDDGDIGGGPPVRPA